MFRKHFWQSLINWFPYCAFFIATAGRVFVYFLSRTPFWGKKGVSFISLFLDLSIRPILWMPVVHGARGPYASWEEIPKQANKQNVCFPHFLGRKACILRRRNIATASADTSPFKVNRGPEKVCSFFMILLWLRGSLKKSSPSGWWVRSKAILSHRIKKSHLSQFKYGSLRLS